MIINELVDRLGGLFRIIGMVVELAWKALTYLAVPVLILEGAGPVDAGYRSAKLIKETWGEGLTGHIGLSAVRGVATLFILLLVGMAYLAGTAIFYAAIPLAVIATIAQMTLFSALAMIFQTVLYRHATGAKHNGFNRELVNGAFFTKDGSPTRRTANAAGLPDPLASAGVPPGSEHSPHLTTSMKPATKWRVSFRKPQPLTSKNRKTGRSSPTSGRVSGGRRRRLSRLEGSSDFSNDVERAGDDDHSFGACQNAGPLKGFLGIASSLGRGPSIRCGLGDSLGTDRAR